ncbi:hypothetical protein [Methylobacter sp.]|uniref:hypothetical protein n=1 Tax=Methylobacter sp. TaxID=2051955 RepID=UPI001210A71E|nr:hypothetical protein [Methylobacter sp.]TAK60944.1 MAG: hypothetical protein EPO18_15525 [Methylobacter sp.]
MNTDSLTIRVECYAGHRGEETPRRFFIGDKSIEIEQIIDCWLAPEYRYFKVRVSENDIYILRHDELTHRWELTMFQSGKYDGSPLSST